jgi:uncharacterized hydrophobic protein (TIGR00271 family)
VRVKVSDANTPQHEEGQKARSEPGTGETGEGSMILEVEEMEDRHGSRPVQTEAQALGLRPKRHHNRIRFSRDLSLWQAMSRGLGITVILALFVLMGDAVAAAGSLAPLAFLLAAVLLLVNLLSYVELSMSVPRAGGAYVLAREADGGWLSFLTGWTFTLVGLAVCALLAQGFAVQVTTLLRDHLGLALPVWPWAAGLVALSAINNVLGTRDRQRELLIVLLMAVLLGFALLAAPRIQLDHYLAPRRNLGGALTLLMIPFVGIEITAVFQSEIRQRRRNAPRALLLTPLLAAVLVALIVAVAVGAVGVDVLAPYGTQGSEAAPYDIKGSEAAPSRIPLALLGADVAGAAGRPFILVVGALALAMALDQALMMVVRQVYAMSSDGFLPAALRQIQSRFRTPALLITLVALPVLPLALLPVNFLGRLTSLLYLLILMGVNLALLRRPQSTSSAFTLPFHPWVPGLTLAVDVLVGLLWGPFYLALAAACLGVGMLLYLLYARGHYAEAQEGVTVFKPPQEEAAGKARYRILVPIANPSTAGTLLHLAGGLARRQDGEVLALQVVVVPDQVPLEEGRHRAAAGRVLLERALVQAQEEDFAMQTTTRVARSVAQGILDTAREEKVDLILLGWRGYTRSMGASMGPIIDTVIHHAPCDVTVAKGREWENVDRILVPTAGGPNAPIAARLAWLISEIYGARVTALNVQLGRATHERMEENQRRIAQTLSGLEFSHPPEQKVVIAGSVVEGIVREAEGYDLVLLGASEQGLFDQFVFGSIPQQIAARVPKTAVIVRRYRGPTDLWTRKLMHGLFRTFPRLNVEEQLELREAMSESARPGVNYFVLITLSCIIASLGLLLDSAAVVIGAMLVAPLMSPILAFSLGMVLGDVRLIRLSVEAVFKGVALAVMIAIFAGIFSPFKEPTNEIMARTQPTLLDLAVALASGMAGAYALARKEVSAALPGVAIAAALMPPLGAVGLGLALGRPQVAGGAFLLFLTNLASISLAGVLVFILVGVRPETWRPEARRQIRRSLVGFALLLLVLAIPLAVIMGGIVRDTARRNTVQDVLVENVVAQGGDLVEFEYQTEEGELVVVATVRSASPLSREAVDALAAALKERLDQPVTLEVVTLPVTRARGQ